MRNHFFYLANLPVNYTVRTDFCGLFLEFSKRPLYGCLFIKRESVTGRLDNTNYIVVCRWIVI